MLKRGLAVLALLFAIAAATRAQVITAQTATIIDPNGIPYSSGTVTVSLVSPGGPVPFITATGAPLALPFTTSLNAVGGMAVTLIANGSISPAGTQYTFRICSGFSIPPPLGSGNNCFTSTPQTITASGDLSNILDLQVPSLINITNPSRIYQVVPPAGTTSLPPTTMYTTNLFGSLPFPATAPSPFCGANALPCRAVFSTYVSQRALGVGCTGNTTIVVNLIFQDFAATSPQTQPIATYTVTLNGTLGIVPLTANVYAGSISFIVGVGIPVQYSTTYTGGTGCTTLPSVQLYPVLEVQ